MKSLAPAIAASFLTIFALSPSSVAANDYASAAGIPAVHILSAALYPSTVFAAPDEMLVQLHSPDGADNQNDSGDATAPDDQSNNDQGNGNGDDAQQDNSDNAQNGDADGNGDADQNSNGDADQNSNGDDSGDNSGQDNGGQQDPGVATPSLFSPAVR